MLMLSTWQIRLLDEFLGLESRLCALRAFFHTDAYRAIESEDRGLLLLQEDKMEDYLEVLATRLGRLQ